MVIYGISLVFLAGVIGGLFLFFVRSYQFSWAILFYELFIFSMLLWVITGGMGLIIMNGPWIDVLNRLAHTIGIFIVTFLVLFAFSFPVPKSSRVMIILMILMGIIGVISTLLTVFTDLIVIETTDFLSTAIQGPFFTWHIIYFLLLWCLGYITLLRRYKEAEGFYRRIIKVLLIGILLTSLLAVPICYGIFLFNVHWTAFMLWLAYFSSVFWVSATLWILIRNRMGKA